MIQDTGFRKRADCTPEESLRYVSMYFATVDLVSEALGKFQILAADASTGASAACIGPRRWRRSGIWSC
jgi:hypothetical protein